MAIKFEKKNSTSQVTVESNKKELVNETISGGIPTVLTSEELANVGVSMGATKNLGNFNNMKVNVSLHLPCLNNPESIDEAYTKAISWVDAKLTSLMADE